MNYISGLSDSSAEECMATVREFDRALELQRPDLEDGDVAWRQYFWVNHGKWDPEALKVLEEEYRQPVEIDIMGPRIDTLAGSIIADLPDPSWIPVKGDKNILTDAVDLIYHTEKDEYNYDNCFLKVFLDGLVHGGDFVITEDYKYDVPAIKIERILHRMLVWDPYWMTDDDRDAEVYWRIAHLNPVRLKNKYGHTCPQLEKLIYEWKQNRNRYSTSDIASNKADALTGRVGDELQVIEKHYLEEISTKRLVGRKYDDTGFIPFPINKDREYLQKFAAANQVDWETVQEIPYYDRIERVTTAIRELRVCPQVAQKSKIQVKGLSAHHFTARRHMGRNMGIAKSIKSIEDVINKRESLTTEHIAKAAGGSTLVNEKLFANDTDWKKFNKNSNRAGYKQRVPLDDVETAFKHVTDNINLSAVGDQISRMAQVWLPMVSRVSEALMSMTDSEESGILFERKFQMNMIANTILNRNVRQLVNNFAESYFFQHQLTHDGWEIPVNERSGNKIAVVLNRRREGMLENWVKDTPRCRVVMAENQKSATYQMRWRSIWAEAMASLSKATNVPETLPYFLMTVKGFFETIDIREEDKETRKVVDDMIMMMARLKLVVEASKAQASIGQNTLVSAQVDMQLQQLMMQMQAIQRPQMPGIGQVRTHEPVQSREIQYPNEGMNINPPQAEAASIGAATPAMTGAPT